MKKPFILFFLILSFSGHSQKLKEHIPSAICVFLGGMSDGARDGTMFRNDGASSWWNGKVSWANKYKNNDPKQGPAFFGSTTFLVALTDAPHAFNLLTHQFNSAAIVLSPGMQGRTFGKKLLFALGYSVARQLGHTLVYEGFFKQRLP
jgi:hypothetical protein